jgi:hypothetical protein
MASNTKTESIIPKRPSMNFGKKPMFGPVGRVVTPKSFVPPPVRVTQNTGGGGS